MQSIRAYRIRKYMDAIKRLPEGKLKEIEKGKLSRFLERCKKQDVKRLRRS